MLQYEDILTMLKIGAIDKAITMLENEIYQKNLPPSAKKRLSAMKRYSKYQDKYADLQSGPHLLSNGNYMFTDGITAVITTENIGDTPPYDGDKPLSPVIEQTFEKKRKDVNNKASADLNAALAFAKAKGYKYSKMEKRGPSKNSMMVIGGIFFKIADIDHAYSIIADDNDVLLHLSQKYTEPLYIKTSIGEAVIMPVNKTIPENKTLEELALTEDCLIIETPYKTFP